MRSLDATWVLNPYAEADFGINQLVIYNGEDIIYNSEDFILIQRQEGLSFNQWDVSNITSYTRVQFLSNGAVVFDKTFSDPQQYSLITKIMRFQNI